MSLDLWTLNPPGVAPENLGNKQYLEYKESGKEQYSPGASTANRVFLVAWAYSTDFIDDLLGYSYLDGSNNIRRVLPDEHPTSDKFFAEDCSVEGIGKLGETISGTAHFTLAKITANYKPRDYAVLADEKITTELDRFVTRGYAFNGDFLTLQNGMRFVTSGRVLNAPPARITTSIELHYTWHDVPAKPSLPFVVPNWAAISSCFGCVNSTTFDPNGAGYSPGTVLFAGVDPKMVTNKLADPNRKLYVGNYDEVHLSEQRSDRPTLGPRGGVRGTSVYLRHPDRPLGSRHA
jgi:hypothetical protein